MANGKTETVNLYELLQKARDFVNDKAPKKDGENEFGKYKYFTPEQVEALTNDAAKEVGCICLCDLKADEFGFFQRLNFIHIETGEVLEFELRTKHGEITATNAAQQMGGTDTYSERYIKMKVFGIKDNSLDPDSQDHSKAKPKAKEKEKVEIWFNPKNAKHLESLTKSRDEGLSGEEIVKKIREIPKMGISKVNATAIINNEI